jgi:hypothetical protein
VTDARFVDNAGHQIRKLSLARVFALRLCKGRKIIDGSAGETRFC